MPWSSQESHQQLHRALAHQHELLHQIIERILIMSAELDRLTASVANVKTVAESAITLINGLAQQIRDNAGDPAALAKLADDLDADDAELAAAVSANTPAPPVVTPPAA